MVHDGGRWDVGVKDNEVYVARIAEDDKQVFDDVVRPDEARKLAGLALTKYADKADEVASRMTPTPRTSLRTPRTPTNPTNRPNRTSPRIPTSPKDSED